MGCENPNNHLYNLLLENNRIMTNTTYNAEVKKIESLLIGFAMKLTRNKENAKDLMQETLMRSFASRTRFKEGTNFKAWVTTIMYNSYINHYRRAKTKNAVIKPIEDLSYLPGNLSNEMSGEKIILLKELKGMVNNLSDTYKIPFKMYTEGYHYNEIAEKMDLPMGTVKSRIFYARKKLSGMVSSRYDVSTLMAA